MSHSISIRTSPARRRAIFAVVSAFAIGAFFAMNFSAPPAISAPATVVSVPLTGAGSVSVDPSGSRAYVLDADGLAVLDLRTDSLEANIPGVYGPVAFSPDGTRAYAPTDDGNLAVIDTIDDSVIDSISLGGHFLTAVAITPDGSRLYVVDQQEWLILVVDLGSASVISTLGGLDSPISSPSAIAITPDGSRAYVVNYSTVSVIDLASNEMVGDPIDVGREAGAIAMTPDGRRAYVVNQNDGTVSVIDTSTNEVTDTITVGGGVYAAAATPDGSHILVTNFYLGLVYVIDTASDAVEPDPVSVGAGAIAIAVSPDGSHAYTANQNDQSVSDITLPAESTPPEDSTPPTVMAHPSKQPNSNGWNNSPVTVSFDCIDSGSGVDASRSHLDAVTLVSSGTATASCVDNAGNVGTGSYRVQIDGQSPLITPRSTPGGDAEGWNNSAITVTFSCDDAGSGVDAEASSLQAVTLTQSGQATASCADKAGNTSNAAFSAQIDPARGTAFVAPGLANRRPEPEGVAVTPNGSRVYVATADGNAIDVFDASLSPIAQIPDSGGPFGLAVTPDGSRIYATDHSAGTVSVVDTAAGEIIDTIPVGNEPTGIAMSKDGRRAIVTNSTDGTVSVLDTDPLDGADYDTSLATLEVGDGPSSVATSLGGAGNLAYVANTVGESISVIDLSDALGHSPTVRETLALGAHPVSVAISSTPQIATGITYAYITTDEGSVDAIPTIGGHPATVQLAPGLAGIAVAPDATRAFVLGAVDNSLAVLNTNSTDAYPGTPTLVSASTVSSGGPRAIALSPDGNRGYVSNFGDGTVSVVDLPPYSPTKYSIDYVLNGGAFAADPPTVYTIESEPITLPVPTRVGYVFSGWAGTGVDGALLDVTIPPGASGDRRYTATWQFAPSDTTPPTITFSGNAGTYDALATVTITCSASDTGSGVASSTCADVNAPAWSFGPGIHTLSAQAKDNVGNLGTGTTSFTVTESTKDLTSLATQFVQGSAKYKSANAATKLVVNVLVTAVSTALLALAANARPTAKAALLKTYTAAVQALVTAGYLTAAQATSLDNLASGI